MRPTVQEFYSVFISILILSFFYIPQSMSCDTNSASTHLTPPSSSTVVDIDESIESKQNDDSQPLIVETWTDFQNTGTKIDDDRLESWLSTIPQKKHLYAQIQGSAHNLEDALIAHSTETFELIGIADGHISTRDNELSGTVVANLLANKRTGITSKIKELDNSYTPKGISQAFEKCQESVKGQPSGSTLSIAIIPNNNDEYVYFANIGDSPIYVITNNGEILRSTDHCVNNNTEVERLEKKVFM